MAGNASGSSNELPESQMKKRLIRLPEVLNKTGFTQSGLYDKMARKEFPKPVPIGRYAVAWLESEVDSWIEERIEARESQVVKPLRRVFRKKEQAAQIETEHQPV
jgi:prophage regulatory protein